MADTPQRPECTKEKVLTFIASAQSFATLKSLANFFRLKDNEQSEILEPILRQLTDDGDITPSSQRTGNTRYTPSEKARISDIMVVKIDRIEGGQVYLKPVKLNKKGSCPTLKLSTQDQKKYKDPEKIGQKLLVRIKDRGGWDADADQVAVHCKVEQELQHGEPGILTGTVQRAADGDLQFKPDLKSVRITYPFTSLALPDMEDGDHIMASVSEAFDQTKRPVMKPIERVWRPGQASSKIALHILNQEGIRLRMPPKVEQEAKRYAQTVTFKKYEDLTHLHLMTIDGRDANERDDAVGALKDTSPDNPDGYVMYTAIADASAYTPVGSSWEKMALENPFSIYAYGRNIDMLPQSLVHGHCSLEENKDRPAIVLKRRMDKFGNIIQSNFIAGIINVNANLSYDRVDEALDKENPRPFTSALQDAVEIYHEAASIRHQYYLEQGMLELDDEKIYPVFDANGMVNGLTNEVNSASRQDIKVGMIDYGILAGQVLSNARISFMGRVHDDPDDDMIDRASEKLGLIGIDMPTSDEEWTPFHYSAALHEARKPGKPKHLKNSATHIILSGIKPAEYEWNGAGHFGVATNAAYIKATSPLRDAAQLGNQRAIKKAIGVYDGPAFAFEDDHHDLAQFETHLRAEEDRAKQVQRQALQAYAIEFLSDRKGQKVAAEVIGYSDKRGLSLRIDNCPLVFDMPVESLELSKDARAVINRMSGQRTEFGSYTDVTLKRLDPMKCTMDLELQINQRDLTAKAHPGAPRYRRTKAKQNLPRAVPIKAQVIQANTRDGITLELNLPKGKTTYKWPRAGRSFGMIQNGVRIYPNKKRNIPGMNFLEGDSVELMVRLTEKGTRIHSVEIPKNNSPDHAQTKRKQSGKDPDPQACPRSLDELGRHWQRELEQPETHPAEPGC